MKYFISFFLLIFAVFGAERAYANGFGITLDKVVGDYTTNVDYDAVNGLSIREPVQFAFQLFSKDRSQNIDFTDVWVTITPKATDGYTGYMAPVFDGGITGSGYSSPGMTFTFFTGGAYDLTVRFDKGNATLAEATFPLEVEGGKHIVLTDGSNTSNSLVAAGVGGAAGIILGASLMLLVGRRKK